MVGRAENVAQWKSVCLLYMKPWVQSPVLKNISSNSRAAAAAAATTTTATRVLVISTLSVLQPVPVLRITRNSAPMNRDHCGSRVVGFPSPDELLTAQCALEDFHSEPQLLQHRMCHLRQPVNSHFRCKDTLQHLGLSDTEG